MLCVIYACPVCEVCGWVSSVCVWCVRWDPPVRLVLRLPTTQRGVRQHTREGVLRRMQKGGVA